MKKIFIIAIIAIISINVYAQSPWDRQRQQQTVGQNQQQQNNTGQQQPQQLPAPTMSNPQHPYWWTGIPTLPEQVPPGLVFEGLLFSCPVVNTPNGFSYSTGYLDVNIMQVFNGQVHMITVPCRVTGVFDWLGKFWYSKSGEVVTMSDRSQVKKYSAPMRIPLKSYYSLTGLIEYAVML